MKDLYNENLKLMKTENSVVWWQMPLVPALGRHRQADPRVKGNLVMKTLEEMSYETGVVSQ